MHTKIMSAAGQALLHLARSRSWQHFTAALRILAALHLARS